MDFENTLGPWLGKTMKMMDCYFQDTFQRGNIDLTKNQWIVLKKLNEVDGRHQNELAFITSRDKTSLTRLISTMEKKELVVRIPSKIDKRINHIHLTKNGKIVYSKTIPILEEILETLQHQLSDNEIETVIKVLKKIQRNLTNNMNHCNSI